jgi:SAM-dependent methyltransferase
MVNKSYVEKKFDIPNTISKEPTYLIRVPLNTSGSKDDVIVRDETIVECVWNSGWKVLRTRLDKTQRYLASGKKIGGTANNIAVAISIWSTIVHPITVDMITGVVPLEAGKKSEYYSNVGTSLTEPLRGFNNYVKALLIGGARKSGSSLIDFSCGRGGDIQKWFSSNYERVVGLDYSRTGIESLDPAIGAYGRIESKKRTNSKFAKWVEGVNLFWADTSKMVTASYQNGICNSTQRALAKKALEMPFDVGMSFFTAHYYFQSPMKIRGFFQNMFDNVKNGGLAVITCFDGLEIFKWLEHLETGQIYSGLVDSKPVWQIKKGYNKHTPFLDNSYNVGLKIDIKFESISDDYLTEYLVHPDYLLKMAEEYGFSLISSTEANEQFGLRSGSALFGEIMEHLEDSDEMRKLRSSELGRIYYNDINNLVNDGKYADLREWNKNNRYFILRKNSVDNTVAKTWRAKLSKYDCEREYEQEEVVVQVDLSEPVESAPVQKLEIVDHVASANASQPKPKAKRTVSRKKSTNVEAPSTEVEAVVVAEQENVALPKKRTLKLKKKEPVVAEEEPVSSAPVSVVPEAPAAEEVAEESNVNVKKRVTKKKSVVQEEVPAVVEEAPAPVVVQEEPVSKANNAPRKKKTLAVGPNVLAMLQKAVAPPSEATVTTAEVTAETQSEVQQAVQTVAVGTKIKISKKLLKK